MAANEWPTVIERVAGIVLSDSDMQYLVDAFAVLLQDRRPSPKLSQFIERLRKTIVDASNSAPTSGVNARKLGSQEDSAQTAPYDLVDTVAAAAILGIKPNAVRDLVRRGKLPAHRAGGRLLLPAVSVIERAERRAAKRD